MTVGQAQSPGQECYRPLSVVVCGVARVVGGLVAGAGAPGEGAGGEVAGAVAEGPAVSGAAVGGDTTAASVPPKIATRPIAASAIMPVATTELVLTDTRGSIQSAR